jgi:hypothetical protein
MSNKDTKEETNSKAAFTKTSWTSKDEAVLIHILLNEKSKGNWGDNNPKKQAWVACEVALAGSEKATKSYCKNTQSPIYQEFLAASKCSLCYTIYKYICSYIYAAQIVI